MKSNNAQGAIALLFLILATASSVVIWSEVSSAVKIAMFAFGFGSGVALGTLMAGARKDCDFQINNSIQFAKNKDVWGPTFQG